VAPSISTRRSPQGAELLDLAQRLERALRPNLDECNGRKIVDPDTLPKPIGPRGTAATEGLKIVDT
jgi:hypothetical protein